MVVLINGALGVGKTTVAGHLRERLPGSAIYDPERVGYVLRRLPGWDALRRPRTDDYQDARVWRWSVGAGVRLARRWARGPVIVPMACSDRGHFDDVVARLRRADADVRVFCLRATRETIVRRLAARGDLVEGAGSEWIRRRVAECLAAHADAHFGEPVATDDRSATQVADAIAARLTGGTPTRNAH
jgi:broad-specificity NMP kinase